jgi:hypothetical protein
MNGATENWYCENIVSGPWPFLLLLLPLAGAYFYGRNKHKLGWILIGIWIAVQIPMSFVNNIVVNCAGDTPPPPLEEAPGSFVSPGSVAPETPTPAPEQAPPAK